MALQICFDKNYFYTVVIGGMCIIAYVIHNIYQELVFDHKLKLMREGESTPDDDNLMRAVSQAQHYEDIQRVINPMIPPLRRGDFNYSESMIQSVPTLVSVSTRGDYGGFQQNGYLYNTNTPDQAMQLMGRRVHSNQYEYYTFHHNNQQIKIPLVVTGKRQLSDGDTVTLPGYPQPFQVKIYELDSSRYIPY